MAKRIKKSSLKPGDMVLNRVSGILATVRGKDGKLLSSAPFCIAVSARVWEGKTRGKIRYPYWNLENLEKVV